MCADQVKEDGEMVPLTVINSNGRQPANEDAEKDSDNTAAAILHGNSNDSQTTDSYNEAR